MELAIVFPFLIGLVAVLFQLGILFMVYLALINTTRDIGRYLAVHPDNTDSTVTTYVQTNLPSLLQSANVTVTLTPSCTSLSNGYCSGRPSGSSQKLRLTYDATANIFLPTNFRLGFFQASVPSASTLIVYDYYVMVEQR